jgi:hypothetical protein
MPQWNFLPETIESLHIDLQRVEHTGGSARNDLAVEAIRCDLLIRVAVMEAALAILQSLTPAAFVAANIVPLIAALGKMERSSTALCAALDSRPNSRR